MTMQYAMADLNGRVAAEVRALMGRHAVTQTRLAGVLGVTQTQVSKRLRGAVPFDLHEVEAIAQFFGMAPSQLLGYAEAPRPDGPDGGLVVSLGSRRARRDSNPQPAGLESLRDLAA